MTDENIMALLAKVEAGEAEFDWTADCWPRDDGFWLPAHSCQSAYEGSLDAAKALHEEVLPGWAWTAQAEGFCYVYSEQGEHSGIANNPARSWLIAILKALIAAEDNWEDGDAVSTPSTPGHSSG